MMRLDEDVPLAGSPEVNPLAVKLLDNRLYMSPVSPVFHTVVTVNISIGKFPVKDLKSIVLNLVKFIPI